MIPLHLKIMNFMSYGEEPTVIDLSPIQVACLSGENGVGKSAILEAITWALWGRSRAANEQELVHHGKSQMEVELDFLLEKDEYRVRRRLDLGKNRRKLLEFQVKDNARFRTLGESGVPETQKKIEDTLHLKYETFLNSSFLAQGRADEFTKKTPAERKEVLGEILGLDQYERYAQRAKQTAKEKADEARREEGALQEMEGLLANGPQWEAESKNAQAQVAELQKKLDEEQGRLDLLRRSQERWHQIQKEIKEVEARISRSAEEVLHREKETAQLAAQIRNLESLLADEHNIHQGFAALEEARREQDRLNATLTRYAQLQDDKHRLQQAVLQARSTLEREIDRRREAHRQIKAQIQEKDALQRKLNELRQELLTISSQKQKFELLRREEATAREEMAVLETQIRSLQQDQGLLQEKSKLMEAAEAQCPVCGQDLSFQLREKVQNDYRTQSQEIETTLRSHQPRMEELQQKLSASRTKIQDIAPILLGEPKLLGEEQSISEELAKINEAEARQEQEVGRLAALEQKLAAQGYARGEQNRLHTLEQEIGNLGYDPQIQMVLQERVRDLQAFAVKMQELEKAKTEISRGEELLSHQQKELQIWKGRVAEEAKRATDLAAESQGLSRIILEIPVREETLARLRSQWEEAHRLSTTAQIRLEELRQVAAKKEETEHIQQKANQEKGIYQELAEIFGKNGVQAMIIETILPEMETEANRLLARMTGGRMHLRFQTQRETKAGEIRETLEIKISDELGSRGYELYSGGEAFRVNFAIRIALSKLLSRRAGARLLTLFIDEGFGTQDTQGRERLVEAIGSIHDEFQRILVITHLEELKEFFPVQIAVHKTLAGSQVAIG